MKEDITSWLSRPSAYNSKDVIRQAHGDKSIFDKLIHIAGQNKKHISWRALWLAWKISDSKKDWLAPHIDDIVQIYTKANQHTHKGIILKILNDYDFNIDNAGEVLDDCMNNLYSDKLPNYIKIESIRFICKISKAIPEIANEAAMVIEEAIPSFNKVYVRQKAEKMLADIKKQIA
jgi:hypothetical protein